MKTLKAFFFLAATLLFIASGCEALEEGLTDPGCKNVGYLQLANGSHNTIQKIMINGTNYGSLDPGDKETYTLSTGYHEYQFVGVNGGGCSKATVVIAECKTEARICRN